MSTLSHLDDEGKARMVDVSGKPVSSRVAVAAGSVHMRRETVQLLLDKRMPKGDVFAVARVAGIMAAKRTPDLIPLCHPLQIEAVDIEFSVPKEKDRVDITARASSSGRTGVEMEALTAVSVAALAIYDMCKAVDKDMTISDIALIEKKGGRSGTFRRSAGTAGL